MWNKDRTEGVEDYSQRNEQGRVVEGKAIEPREVQKDVEFTKGISFLFKSFIDSQVLLNSIKIKMPISLILS